MNRFLILTVCFQPTLIATFGLLVAGLLRSAAHRHSVLLSALLCIMAAPLFHFGATWTGFSINIAAVLPVLREKAQVVAPSAAKVQLPQTDAHLALSDPAAESSRLALQETSALPTESSAESVAEKIQRRLTITATRFRPDWLIAGIWLVGTLLSLVGVLRSQLKTDSILRSARPPERSIKSDVITLAEQRLNAHDPLRIAITGKVAGPAVIGLLRPWILIPARYLETLSDPELLQVLIHEGAHALRRDPLVALLQRICSALYWWHPLIYVISRELTRAREEVCDNFVLTCTEPEVYGATLLRLATLSSAMAHLQLAIGMFDSRGQLESRIERLLDSRRIIMTRVRFMTGAVVLGTFGLFSIVVATTRVKAENPAIPPTDAAAKVAKQVQTGPEAPAVDRDAKQLRLFLTYRGESDKPFYDLILSVPPISQQVLPFTLVHPINATQGEKILNQLRESPFFEHATIARTEPVPEVKPHYLLRVEFGEERFEESLGWDSGTITRLSALRKSFDGDAARSMDQLLARLDGLRKIWESGDVVVSSETSAYENAIDQVVRKLPSDGMWTNGLTPHIDLVASARPEDVIAEAVKKYATVGDGKPYRALHIKTIRFAPPTGTVSAALIQSDAGTKVLIFYPFKDVKGWWTRFYDSDFAEPNSANPASEKKHTVYQKAIDQLVAKLAADGLWNNGRFPRIDLPKDAKPSEVIAEAMRKRDSSAVVQPYRVLHNQKITSEPQFKGASAALVQNKAGVSVLLFSWVGQANGWNWWNRFYEIDLPPDSLESPAYFK